MGIDERTRELRGWVRPRPIRIAFLIEDGEYSAAVLDAIFADCYGRWGGRFSLIIPCSAGKISPSYLSWLEAYDPDVVYSYVALEKVDVLDLHERLNPTKYILHKRYRDELNDPWTYCPAYGFEMLSSLSTIFRLARHTPARDDKGVVQIIDSWFTEHSSRFLRDNFGTYQTSRGNSTFPPDAAGAASLLTIVAPDKQADRRFAIPRDLNTTPSEMTAFAAFGEGQATSLSMIAQRFSPKLDVDAGKWSETFNLVVGEGFADRLLFWNARLLIPSWLDRDLCCFRVTPEQLKDGEFVKVLAKLINRHNHVNAGVGGQTQLTIRSCSLDSAALQVAQEAIAACRPWSGVRTEVVAGIDAFVPSENVLSKARESRRFGPGTFSRTDWTEFSWMEPDARPPSVVPDHLVDAPPRQFFTEGCWASDVFLEDGGNAPRFTNSNRWVLPRRWRMAGAFSIRYGNSHHHEVPPARRGRDGALTVFDSTSLQIDTITVPTAIEAFDFALVQDGRWVAHIEQQDRLDAHAKLSRLSPSNEARYLAGVLGMAGGLGRANDFLLHPFLRKVFGSLGGTPAIASDKVAPTVSRLQKRMPHIATFDLHDEREREALGNLIVKASQTLKNPKTFVRYEDLKKDWKVHRAAFWAAHPEHVAMSTDVDWDEREDRSLDEALMSMRRQQMIFQGHHWTCSDCHHRNWVDMSDLASELACEVCRMIVQTPVAIDWLFRPNEFLIESLRDHSVLSLLWVLNVLSGRSRESFLYTGPTWLWFGPDSRGPDAEADLMVLSDGQGILCEVKSSWHSLRLVDIRGLVELAKRLRPDRVLLAVMELGSGPQKELAATKVLLKEVGIAFEVLTPSAGDYSDEPYIRT